MTAAADSYPVIDVADWQALAEEPMGSKEKAWIEDPDRVRWLFKRVRVHQDPRKGRRVFGEDWSEKLVAEVAATLGIPTARVELAIRRGQRGVISRNVLPDKDHDLIHGNELLQRVDPAYEVERRREVEGYTLEAVFSVLEESLPPPGLHLDLSDAREAFAGYLLLDALVANTDRHHENWAIIESPSGQSWLSPSFDHATSLNFQETEARKEMRLRGPDASLTVAAWAARGRSSHFAGRPVLVDLAAQALQRVGEAASELWRERLERVDDEAWKTAVRQVPPPLMSQVDRTFVLELLRVNRRRLLDACWHR